MSTLKVEAIEHTASGSVVTLNGTTPSNRSLIINGAMQVAQRGTSLATGNAINYLVDRYYGIAQNANVTQSHESSVVPTNFKNSLKFEVTASGNTGYCQCVQRIEGQNMDHLNFGTADAVQFTLSFYVRASITGDYSIAFRNGTDNRSYVTTYNIATANTWERKTVTLTGDTAGTWATDNTHGMSIIWTLGYSSSTSAVDQWTSTGNFAADSSVDWYETNGATWYMTGAQLELGSVATPFEHRSFEYELNLCRRYYQSNFPYGEAIAANSTYISSFNPGNLSGGPRGYVDYYQPMRATPSITFWNNHRNIAGTDNVLVYNTSGSWASTTASTSINACGFQYIPAAGNAGNTYYFNWEASAEL